MENTVEKSQTNRAKIISFALIIPFTIFLLHFIFSFWRFFHYGINGAANLFGLIFYAPIVLIIFSVAVILANFISSRLNLNVWTRIFLSVLLLIIFFAVIFSVEVWRMKDYPNPLDATAGSFIENYFGF